MGPIFKLIEPSPTQVSVVTPQYFRYIMKNLRGNMVTNTCETDNSPQRSSVMPMIHYIVDTPLKLTLFPQKKSGETCFPPRAEKRRVSFCDFLKNKIMLRKIFFSLFLVCLFPIMSNSAVESLEQSMWWNEAQKKQCERIKLLKQIACIKRSGFV